MSICYISHFFLAFVYENYQTKQFKGEGLFWLTVPGGQSLPWKGSMGGAGDLLINLNP